MQIKRQTGTAIFTALFVVAIVSAIAGALIVQQRIEIMRTQQVITSSQAEQYAQGVLYWAMGAILKTPDKPENQTQSENEDDSPWPQELPSTPIAQGRGVVSGYLEQYTERFNINSLSATGDNEAFISHFNDLDIDISADKLTEIASNVGAWVTQQSNLSDEVQQNTTFGDVYLNYVPAYRIANRHMLSISELRLVDGVTSEIYQQLAPHIATYPYTAVKEETKEQKATPEQSEPELPAKQDKSGGQYFLLRATVQLDSQQLVVYYLLERTSGNNKSGVKILWQSLGTL